MARTRGSYNGGSTLIGPRSAGWFTGGSTLSATKKSRKKSKPAAVKSKLAVGVKRVALPAVGPTGAGLTIPEMTRRAEKVVKRIQDEIASTERLLVKLRRELAVAVKNKTDIENMPRRSAIGIALQKAKEPKAAD